MHAILMAALDEAAPLVADRGWAHPTPTTLAEADRLLCLVADHRPPSVQVVPDGAVRLEWEAGEHGWLALTVDGSARLTHSAVIGEDEFERAEDFGDVLPDWAGMLLSRLMQAGH